MAAKEHIINFAFTFDDDAVSERIIEKVEDVIFGKIYENVEKVICGKNCYGRIDKYNLEPLRGIITKSVEKYFEENKDLLLEQSTNMLVEKMIRTKAYREAMNDLKNKYKEVSE